MCNGFTGYNGTCIAFDGNIMDPVGLLVIGQYILMQYVPKHTTENIFMNFLC